MSFPPPAESGFFPMGWLFSSGGQSIRASSSASVLPINSQDGFPLGLTGLFSSKSKGISSVFSRPQFKNISSAALRLLYSPVLTPIHDYWKNQSSG